MKLIARIASLGQVQQVASQKSENGLLDKRSMMLQEFGSRYGDQFIVTLFGEEARLPLNVGDLVVVSLRATTREFNDQVYQDIIVNEIKKIG